MSFRVAGRALKILIPEYRTAFCYIVMREAYVNNFFSGVIVVEGTIRGKMAPILNNKQ